MESIKTLENLDFIINFKRKIRKKDYKNSNEIAQKVAELFYQIIQNSIDKSISTQAELVLLVTHLGKVFTAIDPVQFCIGNTIKRIEHIIKEEINKASEEGKNNDKKPEILSEDIEESRQRFKNMKNFTFGEIEEEKNTRKDSEVEKDKDENEDEDSSEQTSSQKLFELQKLKMNNPITDDIKNNVLKRIEDLMLEIESISDSIKEQKEVKDLISDGDIILTSNYSQQVAEILSENAKTKKFKVFVAESAPLYDGRIQAENLSKKGIDTTIIRDDDIYSFMSTMLKVKVFLGARAILVNGGLITYGGAYNICLSAKMLSLHVPVIIAGGTTKLTPMYSFKHELLKNKIIS